MIPQVIELLVGELQDHLRVRGRLAPGEERIIATRFQNPDGSSALPNDRVGLCLFNVDEERIMKTQNRIVSLVDGQVTYTQPEVRLNLYLLFAANFARYDTALQHIEWVVAYFQSKRVFTPANSPRMPAGLNELAVDLYSLTLEQQNYLWSILGAKYLPSVAYQIRPVLVQDDKIDANGAPVLEIQLRDSSSRRT